METSRTFSERFCGSANHSCEIVNDNSDQATTTMAPVNARNVSGHQKGAFKRFRRWAVKKLRATSCFRTRRDNSRSPEDAVSEDVYVKNIDNQENGTLNNNATPKTKSENEGQFMLTAPSTCSNVQSVLENNSPLKQTVVLNTDTDDTNENDTSSYTTGNGGATMEEPARQFFQLFVKENSSVENKSTQNTRNENIRRVNDDNGSEVSPSNSKVSCLQEEPDQQQQITLNGHSNNNNLRTPIGSDCSKEIENADGLLKYWDKRYDLFSKFDDGIMLDRESFYSVCPEAISQYISESCSTFDVGIDPFCGAGGNVIQLAMVCKSVIAIDIDRNKIKLAKRNAELYGVRDRIKFLVADFFALGDTIKADVLVTSPPWGGPDYRRKRVFPLAQLCGDNGGGENIRIAEKIAPRVVLHLPKNASVDDCVWFGRHFKNITFKNIYLNGILNCMTVNFCSFAKWHDCGVSKDRFGRNVGRRHRGEETRVRELEIFVKDVRLCSMHDEVVPHNSGPGNIEQFRKYMDSVKLFLDKVMTIVPG